MGQGAFHQELQVPSPMGQLTGFQFLVSSNIPSLRERSVTKHSVYLSMYSHPPYAQPQTNTLLQTPRDTLSLPHCHRDIHPHTHTHLPLHTHACANTYILIDITHTLTSSTHTQTHMAPLTPHTPAFLCYLVGLSLMVVLFPCSSEGYGGTDGTNDLIGLP